MKTGSLHLKFKSPYKEIDNLVRAFNRIFARVSTLKKEFSGETDLSGMDGEKECASDLFLSELDQANIPWCIVDKGSHVIVRYSQCFKDIFKESNIKQGTHVVEAFDNIEIVNAISGLIDNPEEESSVTLNIDNPIDIKKFTIEEEINKVIFTFKESSNE